MKKLVVAALMVLSTSAAFAGPSESLKAILKAENYAEAQQLVNSNLAQLTDNAEKAAAYNKLVDLAFGQVDKIRNVMMENSAAQQMGKEAKPVDEEGLYTSLSEAFDAAQECYKYDNLPNAKGKIKAKFSDANAQRLYALRGYLINGGGFYQGKDNAKAFKLLSQYCESADYPMFAKVKNAEDPDLTNAAFFASYMALQNKDYANAEKYSELSLKDPEHGKDALSIKLEAMKHQLNNHEDSVAYTGKVKALFEKDPDNQVLFATLIDSYNALGQSDEARKLVDDRLAAAPNNFVALLVKGQFLEREKKYEEAADFLKKALANAPEQSKLYATATIGDCYFFHAQERLNAFKGALSPAAKKAFEPVYNQAISYYEAAKKLDVDQSQKSLYAPRLYNAYYFLYGEADARTQEAKSYAGY